MPTKSFSKKIVVKDVENFVSVLEKAEEKVTEKVPLNIHEVKKEKIKDFFLKVKEK